MKSLNKEIIEKELGKEIKYAESLDYTIDIEIDGSMFDLIIKSQDNMISQNIIKDFTNIIKEKLKMRGLLYIPLEKGIRLTFI